MRYAVLVTGVFFGWTLFSAADNWPAWRGPTMNGHCRDKNVPTQWSPTENIRWKTPLPGPGNSTPIIWGQRILITQALDKGKQRAVMCFDRKTGSKLWEQTIAYAEKETTHDTNPYCSASPVTDGERIFVSHGSAGVVCYDFEGKLLWRRDLGKFEHVWGNAASPILYGDLVILNCGPGERTFLLAMDKQTGLDVWKVDEPGGNFGEKNSEWIGSWSTPAILKVNDRDELIMTWPEEVKAYNPRTGALLWTCQGLGKLVYTSPLATPEVVVAMSGFHGPFLAVRPGGSGDVTESRRLWREADKIPQRIGTGVIIGDHVFIANENGTLQCLEWKTGKTAWTERLDGNSWGSLVYAEDKLFVTNLEGETFVMAARPDFAVLSRNRLGERTLASIAVADGDIFIRTYRHLWCIGNRP